MPSFLNKLKDKFKELQKNEFFTKRNIVIGLSLGIVVLSLFPGIKLVQQQQLIKSRAQDVECGAGPYKIEPKCDNNSPRLHVEWDIPDPDENGCTVFLKDNGSDIDYTFDKGCKFSGDVSTLAGETVNGGTYTLYVSNGGSCYNVAKGTVKVSCTNNTATPTPTPTASPSSSCAVDSKQNPSVGDTCSACIATNNPTLIGSIKSGISDSQCSLTEKSNKTNTQLINYWCNGGLGDGGSSDCLTKKALCGTSCGYPSVTASPNPNTTPLPTVNNATCGTFTINGDPNLTTVTAGQRINVSLTMNNVVGAKNWNTSENYRLGRWDGNGVSGFLLPEVQQNRVSLPSTPISGGSSTTFAFQVTAPDTTGSKSLELRMVQDGVDWFGQTCQKTINVTSLANKPNPATSVTALACSAGNLRLNWVASTTPGVTYLLRGLKTTDPSYIPNATWTNGHSLAIDIISNGNNENGEASCNGTNCSALIEYPTGGTYKVWISARTSSGISDNAFAGNLVQCSDFTRSPGPSSSPSHSCDFNLDGKWDDKDFKIWVDEFTQQKKTIKADCTGDGKVDLKDFNKWRDEKLDRE